METEFYRRQWDFLVEGVSTGVCEGFIGKVKDR